nr:glycosyltransferase family 2 protein [Agromyces sp. Marseille-P2726]
MIIVTYNSLDVIRSCLSALSRLHSDAAGEVIVVDNASSDGTPELVTGQFPWVTTVRSGSNGGFANGVRLGVEHARGDVFCLLNPDAVADAAAVLTASSNLADVARVGVVAPLICHPGGRLKIVSAGHQPTLWRMFTHYSGLSRLGRFAPVLEGHYLLPNQLHGQRDVEWVTGACLLISRSCWDRVGGISSRWFMYAEDVELCHRARKAGYRVILDSTVRVEHAMGTSTAGHARRVNAAWITNLFDFYSSDLARNPVEQHLWKAVVALGLASRAVVYSVRAVRSRRPDHRPDQSWGLEARRFRHYAMAVLRA